MRGNNDNGTQMPKGARLVFGVLMIFIYLGVGLLFIFDVFNIDSLALSIVIGSLFMVYGVWRAIRLFKGWN